MPKKTEAQMNSELADWVDDYFNQNEVMISLSKIKKPEQLTARSRIDEIKYGTRSTEKNQLRPTKKAQSAEMESGELTVQEIPKIKPNNSEVSIKNPPEKKNQALRCRHYMGYLKTKNKEEKISEECIVCPHSIECLIGKEW
jgi:hypothetical protein